jgi:uncharacterized protein (UPF0332 family)
MARSKQFESCLSSGGLKKFKPSDSKIRLELTAASKDLAEAKNRFSHQKFKYATINSYYSLFHSARALLYLCGYREKSHRCLKIAIEDLYVKKEVLSPKFMEYFEESMGLRQAADYQSVFSKNGAKRGLKAAKEFLKVAKKIFKEEL